MMHKFHVDSVQKRKYHDGINDCVADQIDYDYRQKLIRGANILKKLILGVDRETLEIIVTIKVEKSNENLKFVL